MLEAGDGDGDGDDGQLQQNQFTSPPSPIRSTPFIAKLEENMQRRRKARMESAGNGVVLKRSPLRAALEKLSPARKKQKTTNANRNTGIDPRVSLWHPPPSPFGLLEEELYSNPWKLLVACMLLNKTTASQVRTVIWKLFSTYPTPEAAIAANTTDLEVLLRPLGLFRKRALAIQKLSEEYLNSNWQRPEELHGIGKYAADAYYIFCRNEWRDVQPDDKDLKKYRDWLEETDGLGAGYQRV
jgi:methyl-CpG-binding domain protein 4